ncbi:TIGR03620 family F420-dependent LLM class oxidoreductase [Frankia sp. AiPa1]|uniref:TIGR03620 family F420-dependent LLM class oxidoreductase n=1 Tax=Frankia sp. AiPa1 TaxID=573492 RepID=UPI0035A8588B
MEIRRRLGRFGVWIPPFVLLSTPVATQRREVARIERLGYGSVWSGEGPPDSPVGSRDAFALYGVLLAATERIVVGVGIANIHARSAMTMHTGAATLAEAYPDRFVLGLGGHGGARPLSQISSYLDAMDKAVRSLPQLPAPPYPRVLAALGPRLNELARERADGVHPFLQPVAHTAAVRATMGPDPLVIPAQAVVLGTDGPSARTVLRTILSAGPDVAASPYSRHYRRLGYSETDILERSDRLIDDVLAWGDEDTVAARITAHLEAGADHVLVGPLAADLTGIVDQLERLAPRLQPTLAAGQHPSNP